MNGKVVWTVPAVTFGPDAALLVTFLARAVVRLLLAKLLRLPSVPLAVRAADNGSGLDFLRNKVEVAADVAVAVNSPLDDTEVSTEKREKEKFVIGPGCTHHCLDDDGMSPMGSRLALGRAQAKQP